MLFLAGMSKIIHSAQYKQYSTGANETSGVYQFTVRERREREHTAGIGVSIFHKRSVGTVSDILVSVHIEIDIFDNTTVQLKSLHWNGIS